MCYSSFYCTGFDGYGYSGFGTNPFANRMYVAYSALNNLFNSFYPTRRQNCSCSDSLWNLVKSCPPTGYITGDSDFLASPGSNIPPVRNELSGLGTMPEVPTFNNDTSGLPALPDVNMLGSILSPDIMSAGAMPPMANPMLGMLVGTNNDPTAIMGLMPLMLQQSRQQQPQTNRQTQNNTQQVQQNQQLQSTQNVQIDPSDSTAVSYNADGKVIIGSAVAKRIQQIAQKINCDPQDLMATIYKESGFKTDNWNGSTAVGLIQWTQIAVDDLNQNLGMNLTLDKIAAMDVMQQLDLAETTLLREKSHAGFGENERLSAGELYAMNFLPARARNNILAQRGEKYYSKNRGLDINGDGYITKDELDTRVRDGRNFVVMA